MEEQTDMVSLSGYTPPFPTAAQGHTDTPPSGEMLRYRWLPQTLGSRTIFPYIACILYGNWDHGQYSHIYI